MRRLSMSDKFNVGKTKCIDDISDITDGDQLFAHVEPKLAANGKIIHCDPAVKKVTGKAKHLVRLSKVIHIREKRSPIGDLFSK